MSSATHAPETPEPATVALGEGVRLHSIQTGWVAVKQAHRAFRGPAALRLPAVIADSRWTEWLPVVCFAIEHPEGLIIVDTGESARMVSDPEYPIGDPVTGWFYRVNLRFALRPEDEVGPQLERLGLAPESVSTVVLTHRHSDHMGGMGWFPNSRFLISSRDFRGHRGALPRNEPKDIEREAVQWDQSGVGAFEASWPVTTDERVSIVPTPGHSPGHQSVVVREGTRHWVLAGDAVFSETQVRNGETAGIVEDHRAARRTLATLRAQLRDFETVLLPAHDPDTRKRLLQAGRR